MESLKALFLLGTLKKRGEDWSRTEVLCEAVAEIFKAEQNTESEIIYLRDYNLQPGIKTNIDNDDWPKILNKMLAVNIIIFATPIWWGIHSSLIQRVIERMDELNDELLATGKSEFANKVVGIVITGAEDGAQHIIGNVLNFASWNGFSVPPAPSVSWLGDASKETRETLKTKFKEGTMLAMIRTMTRNEAFLARLLKQNLLPAAEKTTHPEGAVGYKQKHQ